MSNGIFSLLWLRISFKNMIMSKVFVYLCVFVCRSMSFNPCTDFCYHHHNLLLFSHSVMFDSLWPHGLQHARLSCPSPSPGACSSSCPLKWWCHPTILSCHPLLLLSSIFPSIRAFSNESALHTRWSNTGHEKIPSYPKFFSYCLFVVKYSFTPNLGTDMFSVS